MYYSFPCSLGYIYRQFVLKQVNIFMCTNLFTNSSVEIRDEYCRIYESGVKFPGVYNVSFHITQKSTSKQRYIKSKKGLLKQPLCPSPAPQGVRENECKLYYTDSKPKPWSTCQLAVSQLRAQWVVFVLLRNVQM